MSLPSDAQMAALGECFETFARRFKLAEAMRAEQPLAELDKQILLYLMRQPGVGPTDVARYFGVPNTTLTSATDRLVKRRLLVRSRPEADRRAISLRLSDEGQACVDAFLENYREMNRSLLLPLEDEDREHLIRIMRIITHNEA